MASTSVQLRGLGLSCKPSTGIRGLSCEQASVAKSSSSIELSYLVLKSPKFLRGNERTKANWNASWRRRGRSLTSKALEESFDASNVAVEEEQEQELSPEDEQDQRDIAEMNKIRVRKRRDMAFNEVRLRLMIEDPREVERRRQLGIEYDRGRSREDMANALLENMASSNKGGSNCRTLFLVDVHPLCYDGRKPRPTAVLKWMKLLFNQVTREHPVIAVMDGEKGNEYRRQLLPGYKAKRNKYTPLSGIRGPYYKGDEMDLREAFPLIRTFLSQCNVPVLKIENAEADDVVATLMHQAVKKGMRVVVASPDMDFRQLLSEDVNMLIPLPVYGRWSFYTLEQYITQNTCDPSLDLGLRCILGDSSDNVPGLPDLAPGFGRKTALKLMKKHGSVENLLVAAKTRTVGKPYIQEALTQHADVLYKNLQVLKLRRDVDITLEDEWLKPRNRSESGYAFGSSSGKMLSVTLE